MVFLTAALLTASMLATATQAAPATLEHPAWADATDTLRELMSTAQLNATPWQPGHVLQGDEAIVFGRHEAHVVPRLDYEALVEPALRRRFEAPLLHAQPDEPLVLGSFLEEVGTLNNATSRRTGKRCTRVTNVVIDKTETIVDWDVQMSVVFHSVSDRVNVLSVTDGWTVSNTINVGGALDWTWVEDVLHAIVHVDYSYSWATSTTMTISANVDTGKSGVIITKPMTTRRTGRVLKGCVGELEEVGTWEAKSHDEGKASGVKWVQGVVTLCQKLIDANMPLSRCTGYGNFL
ncbi:hypothetical protein P8C59_001054 [Phyllachora maydis]|uniref:Uncharacterized protein n=1 Tax=Phyllachora maydis TaxID=1825666 RepID=A0AAD9HYJ6_9PEZI|nr:hypothetical protein P8C59_001054 [Phyllachora maydis]